MLAKAHHIDAQILKILVTEEDQNNQQVDWVARIKVVQADLDWTHKGGLFLSLWAYGISGCQGKDATYRWARDQGVDLTMDA